MIEIKTCSNVLELGFQDSDLEPLHVPSNDKHTLPQLYKLALNLTLLCPVVSRKHIGGLFG